MVITDSKGYTTKYAHMDSLNVPVGQSVKKGDLLLKFDIERIQNAGYSTQVPIIVTNTQDYMDILVTNQSTIHQNEVLLTAVNAQTTELVANPV